MSKIKKPKEVTFELAINIYFFKLKFAIKW